MTSPAIKPRTTLAALDKDCGRLGAPRDRRQPPRPSALGLRRDVLAQIDVLRGTNAGRKRGLFALLAPGRGSADAKAPALTTARAYDVGAPVRVGGALARAFAQSPGAWSPAGADDDTDATLAFAIEVFEEDTVAPPAVAVAPSAPELVQSPSATPAPVAVPGGPSEVPVALALGRGVDDDGLLGLGLAASPQNDWAGDADQFEREIQSILSGKVTRPAKAASVPGPDPMASAMAPEPPRPHDIFEQMGRNMSYATAFNLPAMELGQRFDQIEQEIVNEEMAEGRRAGPAQSLALTDDEIAANLGWARASGVAAVKSVGTPAPVATVRPVGPPPKTQPAAPPDMPQDSATVQPAPPTGDAQLPSVMLPPDGIPPTVAVPPHVDPSEQVAGRVTAAPGTGVEPGATTPAPLVSPAAPPAVAVTSPANNGSTKS